MKVGYGTEEWVTYILITLSKSAKEKHSEKFPRSQNQPTLYASIVNKENKQRPGSNQRNIQQQDHLEIVHTDLVGPTTTKGLKGEKYFMLLVDDYTRMTAVFFLKNKSEAFENFKIYKEMVENEMDSKIKCLRYDNGGEFTSKEFMDYCNSHGIKRQFFVARTPQQNGVVERKNKTIHEMARTMLMDSKLTDIFWTQAVHTTVHIQNRVMLINNTNKTPYELWKGRPTNVKHFRVFGSKCYIKREDGRMGKFDSRVDK
jgi:transposase InsO family protein